MFPKYIFAVSHVLVAQSHTQESKSKFNEQMRVCIEVRVNFLVPRNIRCYDDSLAKKKKSEWCNLK